MRSLILEALPADPRLLVFLLAFVVIYAAVVAWQWRPARRPRQERMSLLPLDND